LIGSVYPDAHVVHIIRDGRAVARSLLSMDWGPKRMDEAAREWRSAIADARAGGRGFGPRYREVFYEQLLQEPRRHVGELFRWLDLDLENETWAQILSEAASEFNVDPGSPGIRLDKWRDELPIADLRTFERLAGDQLEACGYARASTHTNVRRPPRRYATRLVTARRRYLTKRWRPRTAARAAIDRALSRHAARASGDKHRVVARFERLVAEGRMEEAFAIFTPRARVRVVDGAARFQGRGDAALRKLLAILADHQSQGLRPLSGELHPSAEKFTTVVSYELQDGSAWAQTLVYNVAYPSIAGVAMYRFPLAANGQLPRPAIRIS
jgi:hypothetical protein